MARRAFLLGSLPALCAGCGDSPTANTPKILKSVLLKGDDLKLTRAQVDKLPYAMMAIRLGRGAQTVVVLGSDDGVTLSWISATREAIETRQGRIVATYGLPEDLKQTRFLSPDPVGTPAMAANAAQDQDYVRIVDIEPDHRDGTLVRSRLTYIGDEDISVLGADFRTSVWDETCDAPSLDWQFTNRFWIDPGTGFVWKSLQQTTPALPVFETIVLKPAQQA